MAKKSTKTNETAPAEPQSAEPAVAAKPKAEKKPKAESKAEPKAKKAAKRAKKVVDPIGDETDGEAKIALEAVAAPDATPAPEAAIEPAEDTAEHALEARDAFEAESAPDDSSPDPDSPENSDEDSDSDSDEDSDSDSDEDSDEDEPASIKKPRPPAKLERLQKILAQAGVASRRKAEEMIEQGRVQLNGKLVTALGTKADAGRDHIRVDGKLLQGAERLRYFVLNKPKGFVTTVKDPEGRPTVMQFFDKMRERLYPVGRLDYMSEGLLLVTNDGELANRLTRAAAGVEKTYLVKVAGVPTEGELDQLRAGVTIERGKPGSDKVRTSPARIRQVRQGDNPWYEVVLIEGRNRELRKMFEEVGHFVEKIRRVGYGPLVLDQEPGNLRELDEHELTLLRKAADGTLRTPKSKEIRRRNAADKQLPTVSPKPTGLRPSRPFGAKPFAAKSFEERPALGPKDYRPKRSFEPGTGAGPTSPVRPAGKDFGSPRPAPSRPAWKKDDRPGRPAPRFGTGSTGESRPSAGRPFTNRPADSRPYSPKPPAGRTFGEKPSGRPFSDKPSAGRSFEPRPAGPGRTFPPKSGPSKPAWKKPEGQQRPSFNRPSDRPAPPRREITHDDDLGPVRPPNLHIEEIKGPDRASSGRSGPPRPYSDRPKAFNPRPDRPSFDRPSSPRPPSRPDFGRAGAGPTGSGRSSSERPGSARPSQSRPSQSRPFRGEGGLARPFTTSSGKPRPGGARPNNKSGAGGSRPYSGPPSRGFDSKPGGPSKRPFRQEGEGSFAPRPPRSDSGPSQRAEGRQGGKPGWKPKPSFGGKGKPGGTKSRPPFKSGPKSGGKRPGPFGKKRS
ncbi:MAG: pseudouridine synthase [Terracidiphilus sp.]|jgi:23S rRNA pseudouridine2605 synthase